MERVCEQLGVSQRRACQMIIQPRATQRYSRGGDLDKDALVSGVVELATRYGRYGYRRVTVLLKSEGWRVNHKRAERIWRIEGLKVPGKQPKRGRLWLNDGSCISPNPPMRSGLGVGTRGEGRGTRRSALDSDKWGRWRPLVGVGGADGGPGQRRWGGVGGTACKGRQSRTGPVRLCGVVE